MAFLNSVTLLGNLTRDPELTTFESGSTLTKLGLAVNDRVKKGGEWSEEATFIDVDLWGRTAEIAKEHLAKGSQVLIEGRLKYEFWEKDGQKRSRLKVVGERMQMLAPPTKTATNESSNQQDATSTGC